MPDTSHAGAVSVDERRVDTAHGSIFVREAPGDGPAVVLDSSRPDDTGAIQRTRDYIKTFAALLEQQTHTPEEFFDLMLKRFPGYANPKALWRSIVALTQQQ
jgi:hypothetical protein